ncbi:MAG: glutamate N-acetyltransferase/amino-acid N-acetyltransferase [Verrucomicrobiales bacterium]|jgi:glutamate N-acetyltransferase/amino-acid N-acetyltransferase
MVTLRDIDGGGVTTPLGFRAGAVACGIKKVGSDKLDLMILHTPHPTVAAATFTSNHVAAAPVSVSRKHVAEDEIRAVIVNSGNANACNGEQGLADAHEMCALAAAKFDLRPSQVFVCSTGVIGKHLPMDRIRAKIDAAAQLGDDPLPPVKAIMTSDTVPKYRAVELMIGEHPVRIGAMTKGSGMICPNMATMLCFITTDVAMDRPCLQKLTKRAVDYSFNRITIDGDMSTNDTVLVLANGQAGNAVVREGSPEADAFYEALHDVMLSLAKAMIHDAEKATRFIELEVRGALTEADAHTVAKSVANSVLVKCMWNAGQPYWGRIMHAIGYAGVEVVEEKISIDFNDVPATRLGTSAGTAIEVMRAETDRLEHRVVIDLGLGEAAATVYTSDISENFVEFNLLD